MQTDPPSEPPSDLHLRTGDTSRYRIGGGGPAGYSWSWSLEGDAKCISVAIQPTPAPATPPGLHTSTRDHILILHALHPGHATLHLTLTRSFQPSRPPIAAYTVHISVASR